jgi:hypothetical protein
MVTTTKGTNLTTSVLPALAAPKNMQARTTAGILNIVRIVGTGLFALNAVGILIYGFILWAQPHTPTLATVLVPIGVLLWTVLALTFYAGIGWFVDTLRLLTQIARNTAV